MVVKVVIESDMGEEVRNVVAGEIGGGKGDEVFDLGQEGGKVVFERRDRFKRKIENLTMAIEDGRILGSVDEGRRSERVEERDNGIEIGGGEGGDKGKMKGAHWAGLGEGGKVSLAEGGVTAGIKQRGDQIAHEAILACLKILVGVYFVLRSVNLEEI